MSLEGASASAQESKDEPVSGSAAERFRLLRLALLQRITDDLPELKKKGGVKSIHFLQVLLTLVSELRPTDPTDWSLVLPFDDFVIDMERLVCLDDVDVAATRTANWQLFCQHHGDTLSLLVQLACFIDEIIR